MSGQAFKNFLEEDFNKKLIDIISGSDHIEESYKKGERLFQNIFPDSCTNGLDDHIKEIWNEHWSKYYVR